MGREGADDITRTEDRKRMKQEGNCKYFLT